MRRYTLWPIAAAIGFMTLLLAAGCTSSQVTGTTPAQSPSPPAASETVDKKAIVREAAADYLLSLPPSENKLKVEDLKRMLDQKSDSVFIIDTRKAEDYVKGHIAGAVNIAGPKVGQEIKQGSLPTDKQIVVICYTGQGAMQVTTALRMAGYDAVDLLSGYPSWERAGYPQVSD